MSLKFLISSHLFKFYFCLVPARLLAISRRRNIVEIICNKMFFLSFTFHFFSGEIKSISFFSSYHSQFLSLMPLLNFNLFLFLIRSLSIFFISALNKIYCSKFTRSTLKTNVAKMSRHRGFYNFVSNSNG